MLEKKETSGGSAHLSSDVVLLDGSLVRVGPATDADREPLLRFLDSLSTDALGQRFLGPPRNREELLRWLLPPERGYALLAWHGEKVIAHASYYSESPEMAETGILVSDPFVGKGLGTILIGQLAEAADAAGISTFEYIVSPHNERMIAVIRDLGFPLTRKYEQGYIRITHPTSLSAEALDRFAQREGEANAAATRGFLEPRSVAVIGASRQRGTIGGELFYNLLVGGFQGPVYPVNASADVVQSVPAYRTILQVPGPVDLAVLAVPAEQVLPAAEKCAEKGVRSIVVISAGFGEAGPGGRQMQAALVELCRRNGMRLVGPNCMGIVNTSPDVRLNAQFSTQQPKPGSLGILSQSGAVGLALMDYVDTRGHGISSFVSVGNKADISGNDLLNYWERDERTRSILLYLESFGNPRKFARIAHRVSRTKPIVVVKGGRSSAGFRATQSHTGALLAASDITVDALFRECGVIRSDTLEGVFDVLAFLDSQPIPRGRKVAIVTNAGGAGILAADACEARALSVPELSPSTQEALRKFLHKDASVRNPIDMVASASAENYLETMRVLSRDPRVDAMIVIFLPPLNLTPQAVGASILQAAREIGRKIPVLSVLMAGRGIPPLLSEGDTRVPNFPFPESAAAALEKVTAYGEWLSKKDEAPPTFPDAQKRKAAALVSGALERKEEWLSPETVAELLRCYDIPLIRSTVVNTPEEAQAATEGTRGKWVIKAVAPGLLHKSDVGGVRLGLSGGLEVAQAAREMSSHLASAGRSISGFLLQPMLENGVEMIVGVTHDTTFGPVVACGAGGTMVELLHDVSVRLAPFPKSTADEMIRGLKTYPLLDGFRGAPKRDVGALREVLLRVARMADDHQGIMELDFNPVLVLPEGNGAFVVDARIRVGAPEPAIPLGAKKR